jgi:hypothetical protein
MKSHSHPQESLAMTNTWTQDKDGKWQPPSFDAGFWEVFHSWDARMRGLFAETMALTNTLNSLRAQEVADAQQPGAQEPGAQEPRAQEQPQEPLRMLESSFEQAVRDMPRIFMNGFDPETKVEREIRDVPFMTCRGGIPGWYEKHVEQKQLAARQLKEDQLKEDQLAARQLKEDQLAARQLKEDQLAARQLKEDQLAARQLKEDQLASRQLKEDQIAARQLEVRPLSTNPAHQRVCMEVGLKSLA